MQTRFSFSAWIISRNRRLKRGITLLFDAIIVTLSLWLAFALRLGELYRPEGAVIWMFIVAPIIAIPIFVRLGLYRAIIRYIGFYSLWVVVKAVSIYSLLLALFVLLANVNLVPRSVHIINWLVILLMIGGSRMLVRWWVAEWMTNLAQNDIVHKVVIYGAGASGEQVLINLQGSSDMRVIGFIDDNPSLRRRQIHGVPVYAFADLNVLIKNESVRDVLLAMPSVPRSRRNQIISLLEPYPVKVKTLPALAEIAKGEVTVDDIRDVEIEDLLGRDSVPPNDTLLSKNITLKHVLVSGAGGSIGSELCRQILRLKPAMLILFENSEFALYNIERELLQIRERLNLDDEVVIRGVLGSVYDKKRIMAVCKVEKVETFYHAAAYKHVPLIEANAGESVRNNIMGTLNCTQAALEAKVKSFVLISTDKAVRPTNVMGASKRMAELILQGLNELNKGQGETKFCMVRFGNVLGSSGSVIPLFKAQIKAGGPVTVTDPKMIRYFMTIPEAAQLVIQAGAMMEGGEVFVLDMGEPVRIQDLAVKMIHLSGMEVKNEHRPDGDILIKHTGLRPGEKLYEELLIGDNVSLTEHPKIMCANEDVIVWAELNVWLKKLQKAADDENADQIKTIFEQCVAGYQPSQLS